MTATDTMPAPSPDALSGLEEKPFFIVLNAGSGRRDADETSEVITRLMAEAGRRFELLPVTDPTRLIETARTAVRLAHDQGGIVVAAGGDGTLNAVSSVVLETGLPFGILPRGTFNYVGRAHGIPQDTEAAVRCLLQSHIKPAQVGLLNGRPFLVNASFGLYPRLLEDREAYKQRYGRSRWVALWSAVMTLAHAHRQLKVQVEYGGTHRTLKTPTIVVDNNPLQLRQMGIRQEDELEHDHLVAITSPPVGTLALYGILIRGLLSRLGEADNVITFAFNRLTVHMGNRRHIKVATDGEIFHARAPLVFEVAPHKLQLLVPRADATEAIQ
ncbi:Diacylglycerol kinase family enzyme [Halopseudomonas xinjiangensis]|uniref:Diacylglycerol kinase family enzyme n=1 Tax=Halopseudomonas xinjiangensis TaxID=487184 RepID=A0A1H1L5T9_9GAMM|nr:diacylglycerol kinase family protein [Halopseudomonas xinjiangensis]SDR69908.1 Diacylglycerol kinase family enzyme [Halopseudomonas xinjiangensis]